MDLATIIGLIACFALMIFGMVTGDQGFAAIGSFIHLPSVLITFGGAFSSVLIQYTLVDFVNSLKAFRRTLKQPKSDDAATIKSIIELSNIARKEGLLALEEAANELEDEFMKKGILLIVDGTDPEMVRSIMENEMICIEDRHKKVIGFYDNVASMGPAWGMIGTLIGLINMLKNLQDISSVGPNMSTALVTTFYGSLLANWVATPVANKLRLNNSTEIMLKEVMIEGLLSIQAGENPRVIEEKLKSFLSPQHRNALMEGDGDAEGIGGGE
ncbi:MAG: motility protein A [Lachnospiraceae bacterium]|nr:motility protein A [Lachnospiraceae bacterium]